MFASAICIIGTPGDSDVIAPRLVTSYGLLDSNLDEGRLTTPATHVGGRWPDTQGTFHRFIYMHVNSCNSGEIPSDSAINVLGTSDAVVTGDSSEVAVSLAFRLSLTVGRVLELFEWTLLVPKSQFPLL